MYTGRAHRVCAAGAQAGRARGKAKERRDASARAGTGPDTARGGGEQGGAEPKKPARKGRAHRSGLRGRQSGAEIEGEMRREQPRTGAAARRSRGNEPCVAAARKRGMRAEKSGNRRDCPPVRMGAPVARKHGKGKRGCLGGLDGWGDRARHPVAGGGVQKKRCSAGRAADRAKRERAAPPPGQVVKNAALSLPPGGTKGCRKSGARHRWQDGWVKKEVRPGGRKMWKREGTARRFAWAGTGARHPFPGRRGKEGQKGTAALRAAPPLENPAGEARLRRAPQRPWKSPQKAASDEPNGKHRRGVCARHRWQDGWVKKEVRPGGGGEKDKRERRRCAQCRRWKIPWEAVSDEPNGKHRLGDSAKPRRKPPQTSPSGSIASATLQKPVEGRLRRDHREASPRRPCAVSLAGRLGKGRSMTRARGKMRKREGTARRFA